MKFTEETRDRDWERLIRRQNKVLRACGVSDVRKNWEAPTVPGKQFLRRETSAPDFGGTVFINDRVVPVLFEAKSTRDPDKFKHSNINGDQLDDLARRARLGGLSFIYVLAGSLPDVTQHFLRVYGDKSISDTSPGNKYSVLGASNERGEGETWLTAVQSLGWIEDVGGSL